MTLRDRIPVEPLEEERLARIERAVIAGLPARPARRSPWPVLVPVAVLAAFVAFMAYRARPGHEPARAAEPVVVSAAPDGTRVDLGDAVITTGAGASFTVTRPDGGVAIHLAGGRIDLDVAPRKGRPPLVVYADDVEVIVVGTRFSVEWDDEVTVIVTEGLVRVERGGATEMVAAGEQWSQPARVAVAVATPEVGLHDRTASAPPAPDVEPEVAPTEVEAPKKKPKKETPAPVVADPLDDLRSAIRTAKVTPPVANYEELVKKTGKEGAQGLYGLAHKERSLRLLDSYVRRFPEGDELADVLWLRLRVLCLAALDGKCRTAAHTFIGKFGDDHRRGIADRVTYTD